MATFTKRVLSGSTDGRPILVDATAIGSGTTIHTVSTGIDLVTLMVANIDTAAVMLTVGWGETTNVWSIPIPANTTGGLTLVTEGMPLQNSLAVKLSASAANKLLVMGNVERIA